MADDFGDTIQTAGTLSVGGAVFGSILDEGLIDQDMFEVTLAAGTVYQFDLAGSPTPTSPGAMVNSVLDIYDNAGNPIATSGLGDDPRMRLTFAPSSSGSYYLLASAWQGTFNQVPTVGPDPGGTYRLSAIVAPPPAPDDHGDTPATAATGATSAIRSGTIEASGDADWFGVELVAGQTYYFDLENGFGDPAAIATLPTFRLHDSTGAELLLGSEDPANHPRFDDGSGGLTTRRSAVITYTAPTSGTYFLSATGTPPSVSATGALISLGAYTVSVQTSGLPIETIGETWLYQRGNGYSREFVREGADFGDSIALKYQSIDVVAGQFGDFTPIGADGGTVVWANAARTQFMIWETDSNGNYAIAPLVVLPASDPALALLEARFQQDLNSDGVTGIPLDPALAATLSIAPLDARKPEGSTGIQTAFTFRVTRTGNTTSSHAAVVHLGAGAVPGTLSASAGDFNSILPVALGGSATLVFQPGETSKILTIIVRADSVLEFNESFALTLTDPSINTTLGTASASGIVLNDDSVLSIAPLSASKPEGTGGNTAFTFTVTRAGDISQAGSVDWSAAGLVGPGTLPADAADFAAGVLPSGTVTFAPGATSQTIKVSVVGDVVGEFNERFQLTLAAPSAGSTIAAATADAVIFNDDISIGVVATGQALAEGNAGTRSFAFAVQRKGTLNGSNDVTWSVAGIGPTPATASDFAPSDIMGSILPSGTVSFAPGETSKLIIVSVTGDTTVEPDEQFQLTLSAPTNGATLHQSTGIATILNDDAVISIAALSANKPEGTVTPTPFTFTVTRTGDTTKAHTAKYAAAGTSGTGTQPADATDFAGSILPSGTVTFAPGETTRLLTINVAADQTGELNERFAVTLSAPSPGATIATATAQGVILNDDVAFAIRPLSASKPEGTGTTTPFTFAVTRTGVTRAVHALTWQVAGEAGPGTMPSNAADFAGSVLPGGTITFGVGETTKTITVDVAADATGEFNERFGVTLSNAPVGSTLATATAGAVIFNDDTSVGLATIGIALAEGNAGATKFTYTVARSGLATDPFTVDWHVAGGSVAGTLPTTGADFVGGVLPGGTLSFLAGQTTATITVAIAGDTTAELNESFTLELDNPTAAVSLKRSTADGVVYDDDTIISTAADQTLTGTAGPDLFLLGGGMDVVIGDTGLDAFRFLPTAIGPAASNATTFEDFSRAAGEKLDLFRIDAIAGGLDNAFSFIGTAAFNGTPGQLRWEDRGTIRLIQGNVNNDTTADLTIFVKAAGPVDSNWFVL